ncbi:histidine--tRNA ligase [Eubacteriales bacterium OttesenSCG-928-N13]|nr:histidine--tRNA ligase [Eubacteriales bacterium OttesenSCG-928-N13]
MLTQAPKGTKDILPQDSANWQFIEQCMRDLCALGGYREIRTPVFEHTELFLRGVGDTTDVVQKEMYTFDDKGGRSITLKPEGTAGAVRAFLEAHLESEPLPCKMYYISTPVFRYEKPQSGRLREHHQLGIEVFGAKDASCDAEGIKLALDQLKACGIEGLKLAINSIGCPECRKVYNERLKEFLRPLLPNLCSTCNDRFERNPMRILDCKVPEDQLLVADAPSVLDCLCEDCQTHFDRLQAYLSALGIDFVIDPRIVRGLDYYSRTVFEIITETENGPLTVCGGGRYDGLIEQLGGPATPGFGFGMGVERILMLQQAQGYQREQCPIYDLFIATMGDEARIYGLELADALRKQGVHCDIDHAARSLKAQFKCANKMNAPKVAVIAGDELAKGIIKLRDMAASEERELTREQLIEQSKEWIKE